MNRFYFLDLKAVCVNAFKEHPVLFLQDCHYLKDVYSIDGAWEDADSTIDLSYKRIILEEHQGSEETNCYMDYGKVPLFKVHVPNGMTHWRLKGGCSGLQCKPLLHDMGVRMPSVDNWLEYDKRFLDLSSAWFCCVVDYSRGNHDGKKALGEVKHVIYEIQKVDGSDLVGMMDIDDSIRNDYWGNFKKFNSMDFPINISTLKMHQRALLGSVSRTRKYCPEFVLLYKNSVIRESEMGDLFNFYLRHDRRVVLKACGTLGHSNEFLIDKSEEKFREAVMLFNNRFFLNGFSVEALLCYGNSRFYDKDYWNQKNELYKKTNDFYMMKQNKSIADLSRIDVLREKGRFRPGTYYRCVFKYNYLSEETIIYKIYKSVLPDISVDCNNHSNNMPLLNNPGVYRLTASEQEERSYRSKDLSFCKDIGFAICQLMVRRNLSEGDQMKHDGTYVENMTFANAEVKTAVYKDLFLR